MSDTALDRIAESFERIATALEGIHEFSKKYATKHFPDARVPRDAVITRVPTEDDLIRESQGSSPKSLDDWLSELTEEVEEEDIIGPREREFLERNNASAEGKLQDKPEAGGAETLEGQASSVGMLPADNAVVEERQGRTQGGVAGDAV